VLGKLRAAFRIGLMKGQIKSRLRILPRLPTDEPGDGKNQVRENDWA
jgi:hypothetical protein